MRSCSSLITDDIAIRRITGRFTCPACKRTYHQEFGARRPPTAYAMSTARRWRSATTGHPDREATARDLQDQTQPLEAFYAERDSAAQVDATRRSPT
jgi:uncharacterized Zn finger protein (UPF0148 family)